MGRGREPTLGEKFGRLEVVEDLGLVYNGKQRERRVLCKCDCGACVNLVFSRLKLPNGSRSCGCLQRERASEWGVARHADSREKDPVVGLKFGRLEVIEDLGIKTNSGAHRRTVLCRCQCGTTKELLLHSLRSGNTKSCGCHNTDSRRRRLTKHGRCGSREWRTWQGILNRCYNKSSPAYRDYGAKGVRVCSGWKDNFERFFADLGEQPGGTTADRIKNEFGYCCGKCDECTKNGRPENVRWGTSHQQGNNRTNNRRLKHRGETRTLTEWSRLTGIAIGVIQKRLDKYGWSVERTLSQPVLKHNPDRDPNDRERLTQLRHDIVRRCNNPDDPHYGGKGITYCSGLTEGIDAFLDVMGPRPSLKHSVGRVNNDQGYWCGDCEECESNSWPRNVEWQTGKQQANATSRNRLLTHDDQTMTLTQWSELTGLSESLIRCRLDRLGWPVEKALTTPRRLRTRDGAEEDLTPEPAV